MSSELVNEKLSEQINKHITYQSLVAMAVYSGDRLDWIEAAVFSVLSQSYEDFAFAIVIDGKVEEEIRTYLMTIEVSDSRVFVFSFDDNKGLSLRMRQLTEILPLIKADYFFRMDADDVCHRSRMEKQVQFLLSHPEVDVVGSSLIEIDEMGHKVGKRIVSENHSVLLKALSRRCPLNHPTVCIKATSLEKKGNYRKDLKNTQDYYLWIEMAKNGAKFANIREPLLYFRRAQGFYKRRGKEKSINELKARFTAMKELNQWSLVNLCYAIGVFVLRMMPASVIKLAYKLDRAYFHKRVTDK